MTFIWIRSTVDWGDEDAFNAQLPAAFRSKVDLWNSAFEMPFHLFRARVAEIARLCNSRVEGATTAAWEEIPEGALVLPTDDDDWFAPDAAAAATASLRPGDVGVRWLTTHVEVPTRPGHRLYLWRRRLLPFTPPAWLCATNNYAMVKRTDNRDLLAGHVAASRWVGDGRRDLMPELDRRLSVANRTLASMTTLGFKRPAISRRTLMRRLRGYRRLYRRPVRGCAWATPYVEMMDALMAELRLRA